MLGSMLYQVPSDQLESLEADDGLEDFEALSIDALDFGYWELFAHELAKVTVFGRVLSVAGDEAFTFQWSPAFVEGLLTASVESLRAVAQALSQDPSSKQMSVEQVVVECEKLRTFLAAAQRRNRVIIESDAS